jgi:hypothetical protein
VICLFRYVVGSATTQPDIFDGTSIHTLDGKPALSFSADALFSQASGLSGLAQSWFFVGDAGINASGNFFVGCGRQSIGEGRNFTSEYFMRFTNSTQDFSGFAELNVRRLHSIVCPGTISNISAYDWYRDGVQLTPTSPSTTAVNALGVNTSIGIGTKADSGAFFTGNIQEAILWNDDKSSERTGIETNINTYYEIIVNDEAATSGFLFDYPNAAVAYSVRQLNNNAEYAMQVMRSDGRAKNIGFDGNGDLDTQAIIDFSGGNEVRVRLFYDQTGAQNHSVVLSNESINKNLIYDGTSIITENGMPMVRYSLSSTGSSRSVSIANNPLPQGLTHSVYAVGQRPSAPNAIGIFRGDGTPSITGLYQERSGNLSYGPGWTSYGIYTYPTISNAQRLYAYIRQNGTDGECWNDGVLRGTTSAMTATTQVRLTGWEMRKSQTGLEEDCSGLQELIYYNDDRTSVGDNTNILSDIKTYFTIP